MNGSHQWSSKSFFFILGTLLTFYFATRKMSNQNKLLYKARNAKKDEFYTQLNDIANELKHYKEHFKWKTVLIRKKMFIFERMNKSPFPYINILQKIKQKKLPSRTAFYIFKTQLSSQFTSNLTYCINRFLHYSSNLFTSHISISHNLYL